MELGALLVQGVVWMEVFHEQHGTCYDVMIPNCTPLVAFEDGWAPCMAMYFCNGMRMI